MLLTSLRPARVSRNLVQRLGQLPASFASSPESRIAFGALLKVGPLGVLARVLTIGKAMMVAHSFGSGRTLDAFYIALLIPMGLVAILGGSVSSSFVPVYLEAKHRRGAAAAQRLFSSFYAVTTALFIIFGVVLMLLCRPILALAGHGFDASTRELTERLFLVLAPAILLTGIPVTWTALLNAEGCFGLPAASRSLGPITYIAALALLPRSWGIYSLAAGTAIGALCDVLVLGYALRRYGFSLVPRWYGFSDDLRSVARQFTPGITCSVWSSGAGMVDQSMAAALPSGSVASLNYGTGMVGAAIGVIGDALGIAMLPSFSRLVAARAWTDVRRLLRHYVWTALGIGTALMVFLMVLSRPLIVLLYQRGAFGVENTNVVTTIQMALALQIPAALAAVVVLRLLAAMQRTWVRAIGGIGNLILDVVFNLVLIRYYGVTGIALSTSFVCIVSTIYLALMLRRELRIAERRSETEEVLAEVGAAVMADAG